ncbi:MAG TPA: bifunctional lysylphosphatidylglycerol flippase/synthetase MprF [Steroidobacteraceae bacterium]|nr:bifunctional lysylphosphatidylglycerol flippase/synthetase MprF [Steroidobacteraceae bacterium]
MSANPSARQGASPGDGSRLWVGPVAALLVFSVMAWLLHRELEQIRVRDIIEHLEAIPSEKLLTGLLLTAGSYLALCLYDFAALRYLHKKVPLGRVVVASFIANAFGHNLGFAAFTGGAFRLRLYASSGLTAIDVATVTGFTSITTGLGLAVLAGLSFLFYPGQAALALRSHADWPLLIGAALLGFVGAYFVWTCSRRARLEFRGWLLRPPGARIGAFQIIAGTFDLGMSCGVLWLMLPVTSHIGFVAFAGAYAIGVTAGIISHVPGGLGVFETVVVLAVPQIPADALLGSLLAYRAVFYLAPLGVATVMFAAEELGAQRARLAQARARASAFIGPVVPSVVGALTFIAGAELLFSGATHHVHTGIASFPRLLPLPVVEVSHLAGSAVGLGLLILARALFRRIRAAYHISFWLLLVGGVLTLLKGGIFNEALFLWLVLGMLVLGRASFYRPASLVHQRFTPTWAASIVGVIVASIWVGLLVNRHIEYSNDLWWTFTFDANAPRMLRASLLVCILTAGTLLMTLLRAAPPVPELARKPELDDIRMVLDESPSTLSNAVLTGDKHVLFSESQRSFIMYQVQGRSWIALGDPVGPRSEAEELVWRFRELSDEHGGRVVFYQSSVECLPLYVDLGLAAMKIGEEARVPLANFSLEGSLRAELRTARRRGERDRATFEVVQPADVPQILPALRAISDSWLKDKATAEKGFSVGSFGERYLRNFPIALVRRDGEPVAFANLWPSAGREEVAVDLMRFSPDAPPGAMDFLFVELMLWARQQGFSWFSLGVAPLAGLERHPLAPAWHRIGNFIFRHGEHFYNFEGLRRYKAKFHPVWEPKYLVAPGGVGLPLILVDVSVLIAGGIKELFVK